MAVRLGDTAPDFEVETTDGAIKFHDWIGDGWAILFSHPKDFTPVCTTELGYMAGLQPEFAKRNCKIMGLSIDSVEDHAFDRPLHLGLVSTVRGGAEAGVDEPTEYVAEARNSP